MARIMNQAGIYEFRSPSGKVYLGSTVCFSNRLSSHMHRLRRGVHHSAPLQAAYNKYGESKIKFSIVLVCSKDNRVFYEQLLLDALHPKYNVSPTAGSPAGITYGPMSIERKQKISKANKGKTRSEAMRKQFSIAQKRRTTRFDLAGYTRGKEPHNVRRETYDGKHLTLKEWSCASGIPYNTLKRRLQLGWSFADSVNKPLRRW